MDLIIDILQIVIALGLLNVWLLRFGKASPYRGRNAGSMKEEFAAYGLPEWFMWLIGCLKVCCALALIAGVWIEWLTRPAAALLVLLMLGAVAMHIKVGDPLKKSLPALTLLVLSSVVAFWG